MTTIKLSEDTYELLTQRAQQSNRTPDVLADEMLRRELQPAHPYIEIETTQSGKRAVVKDARTPVSWIVGYARLGVKPEAFAKEVHSALTPAHVHDALSYYYDHRDEIDREIEEDTEPVAQRRLREQMRSDEHVWTKLASLLREQGYDAVHVQEENRSGISDEEQWDYATKQRRAILTFDKAQGRFARLASQSFYEGQTFYV